MHVYLIICEVTKPEDRYRGLLRVIESHFENQRLGRFVWAIESDLSAADVCDLLSPQIMASDRLIIVRATRDLVWSGFPPQAAAWLRKYALRLAPTR